MGDSAAGSNSPWDAKQQQILGGAQKVFAEFGFDGASVNDIALRAGVSKATLYNHFADKDTLFAACVRERSGMFAQEIAKSLQSSKGSIEHDLSTVGEAYLLIAMSPESIGFFRMVMAESARHPTLGKLLYESGPKASAELLGAVLQAGMQRGELDMQDPLLAAHQFLAICKCEAETRLFFGVTHTFSSIELQTFVGRAVRTFMLAYGRVRAAR